MLIGTAPGIFAAGAEASADPPKAVYGSPVVDGFAEGIWEDAPIIHIPSTSSTSTSADCRLMWDRGYLYVLAEINDSTPYAVGQPSPLSDNASHLGERNDTIELWINWTNSTSADYYADTAAHYIIDRNNLCDTNFRSSVDVSAVKHAVVSDNDHYTVEVAIPLPRIIDSRNWEKFGINFSINDDMTGDGYRDAYITWYSGGAYWNTPANVPEIIVEPRADDEDTDLLALFQKNLVLYLPFDGNSVAIDPSATATNGLVPKTENNVTYEEGMYGQAARFTQRSSHVDTGISELPADYSFTFSTWIKDYRTESDPAFFSNKPWTSGANQGFVFCTRGSDVRFNMNAGNVGRVDYNVPAINDGRWHMFTGVIDRQKGVVRMYIDGRKQIIDGVAGQYEGDISKFAGQALTHPNYTVKIGNDGTGNYGDATPNHAMDDFFFFDKALSDDEIMELYSSLQYIPRLYFQDVEVAIDCEDSILPGIYQYDEALTGDWTPRVFQTGNSVLATVDQSGRIVANSQGLTGSTKVSAMSFWSPAPGIVFPFMPSIKVTINEDDGRIFRKTDEVAIEKGSSKELPIKAVYVNNPEVTYVSGNPGVVTVENGSIVALAQGTATLTAKKAGLADDVLIVRVSDSASEYQLFIDKDEWSGIIPIDTSGKIAVMKNSTGSTIVWSSSDASVVEVDNDGNFTAKKSGTVRIVARAGIPSGSYIEDWLDMAVGIQTPFNFRIVGAEWATVGTPFLMDVHFDTGTTPQPIKSIETVYSYDPAVFEFVPGYRATGGTYVDDPVNGKLSVTYSFGGNGRTNASLSPIATSSRIGTFCFMLKENAPRNADSVISVESTVPFAENVNPAFFEVSKNSTAIKTCFNPEADYNGDGLVSIGDVALAQGTAAESIAKDPAFGFYPVKRIVYLGIDGGGNYLTSDGYYTTNNSTYTWAGKPERYTYSVFEGLGGLAETGSYTTDALTSDPPISGQNWTAMFYGYEPTDDMEFEITNGVAGSFYYPTKTSPYKSILELLREAQPSRHQSTFIEWGSMENGITGIETGAYAYRGGNNATLHKAVEMIEGGFLYNSSFMFIDCDHYMDGIGHSTGWYNDTFYEAGKVMAEDLDKLVKAIESDEKLADDTVFMMSNDHGGYGTGHGNWRPSEYYMMMYSKGPVIKSGYKYKGDNGIGGFGKRPTAPYSETDARQKDWPALFAKAMGIEGCKAWVGTTDNHDIFIEQREMAEQGRDVEVITLVKTAKGYDVSLSNIHVKNEGQISAAHLIISGIDDPAKLTAKQDASILYTFVKDGKLNVVVKTDGSFGDGPILSVDAADGAILENAMLGKKNGLEIYVDLLTVESSGAVLDIRADAVSGIEGDVEYVLSLIGAHNALTLELEFEIDGSLLAGKAVEALSGFTAMNDVFWTYGGGDVWKGSLALAYKAGDSTGFTSQASADIAKFVFSPKAMGEATMKLTGIKAVGLDKEIEQVVALASAIGNGEATTTIEQTVWSKYDLNKDGKVDALDLGVMLLYVGFDCDSPDWDSLIKVNDSRGRPVTASMCDVNSDGVIDMLDLIDLFLHYTK